MYDLFNKLFSWIGFHAAVLCVGIGMGLYRCAHEWPVWCGEALAAQGLLAIGPQDLFLWIDAGKLVGVVAYTIVCYRWDPERRSGALLLLPSALLIAGYTGPLAWSLGAGLPPAVLLGSLVLCGIGAGMLFAQWIEACGYLSPLKVIEALAVSYLARIVILPIATGCALPVASALIMVLAGSSCMQIALAYRIIAAPASSILEARPRVLIRSRAAHHGVLFAWTCVFTFAFGLGEASTHLAHEVVVSGLGYALPSLLVAVLGFKLADRFDRNMLYAVSIPLMGAGLVSLEFLGASAVLGQILVSAGMCAFELLVYTTACSYGFRTRTSSMLAGSTVRALALLSADIAVVLVRCVPTLDTRMLTAVATFATVAMGFAMFVSPMSGRREPTTTGGTASKPQENTREGRIELAAAHAGLSPRERTVFDLLVQGKTAAHISEELFISNGAVRAHCSRIYAKFGVHTRKEFDEVLARM